jgi:hypothetical protein
MKNVGCKGVLSEEMRDFNACKILIGRPKGTWVTYAEIGRYIKLDLKK